MAVTSGLRNVETTPIESEGGLLGARTFPYTPRIRAATNHTRTMWPRPSHSTLVIEMHLISYEASWTQAATHRKSEGARFK